MCWWFIPVDFRKVDNRPPRDIKSQALPSCFYFALCIPDTAASAPYIHLLPCKSCLLASRYHRKPLVVIKIVRVNVVKCGDVNLSRVSDLCVCLKAYLFLLFRSKPRLTIPMNWGRTRVDDRKGIVSEVTQPRAVLTTRIYCKSVCGGEVFKEFKARPDMHLYVPDRSVVSDRHGQSP